MRLIDADALKENLKKLKAKGDNRKYVQGLQDAIDGYFPHIIDDMPTIEAEPDKDWINIKDRLPEPKTWVTVYIEYPSPVFEIERGIQKTSNIKKVFYDGFYDGFCKDKNFCGFGTITHWMPMPKPPKKNDDI